MALQLRVSFVPDGKNALQSNPKIANRWLGQTVAIIGSGNSLTDEQINYVVSQGWKIIVINDTWQRVPQADVLYACDGKWWDAHIDALSFKGERWTQDLRAKRKHSLAWVLGRNKKGLGLDCVHFGGNSGYQAINLAYLWGCKRIILLGFDCKPVNGLHHWFGQHQDGLNKTQNYALWLGNFEQLAIDLKQNCIEVINCSLDSALNCFPKKAVTEIA
jgi:hypothetical protein